MRRRTFLGKTWAGIALHLVPFSLIARSSTPANPESVLTPSGSKAANAIANGLIGEVYQVLLTHTYSPEQTDLITLQALVKRDVALTSQLSGLSIPFSEEALFAASHSASFGSFSTELQAGNVRVLWQALARIGSPTVAPTRSLGLFGSTGVFQTTQEGYQVLNLNGQAVLTDTQALFPNPDLSTLS